jgi:uncharacterized protein YndB with AHSA1/START domain
MIDVRQQINSVRREVGTRVLEAGEARTVTVSRSYPAPIDEVWDACTNAERIPRWFLPISGDLRLGGHYQLEGNASGTIESCDPPRSFGATWEFGGRTTWIEVRLAAEAEGRTRLEIEHIAHVDDDHWLQFGPGAVGVGWDMALIGLTLYFGSESRETVDRDAAAAWIASEDGRRFVSSSSERWRDASIAAGEDAEWAGEAARRTTDAYLGAPS